MHLTHKVGLVLALLTVGGFAALPSAQAQAELVTNGGFETGSFSGWNIGSPGDLKVVKATDAANYNAYPPHSGTYCAQFASSGVADDVLTQTLPTTAGDMYAVSFWLANDNQGIAPLNDFKVAFGGNRLLDLENTGDFAYTHYQFTEVASGSLAALTFSGRQPPGAFYLDDVSVTALNPVPEASSLVSLGLLLLLGLGGVAISRRRKAGAVR